MSNWNSTFKTPGKPMKRGTPLSRTKALAHKAALKAGKKKLRQRGNGEDKLCRGQDCYLLLPGIEQHARDTVVPCHSNQSIHGKSMGRKADDQFTVPGCWLCHRELDQGSRFAKEEKFAFWDAAYARWKPVRDQLMDEKLKDAT